MDATVQNALQQEALSKVWGSQENLAPDLMACWIRPRECTSEQPVPLAPGTEGKLHTHKVALRYGCKKARE